MIIINNHDDCHSVGSIFVLGMGNMSAFMCKKY